MRIHSVQMFYNLSDHGLGRLPRIYEVSNR